MSKRKKKEILVEAPARSGEPELLKDTIGAETVDVFRASEKIGRALSFFMFPAGVLLSFLSLYGILISPEFSFSDPMLIGPLGFLGAINILCGLILLAKS